MNHFLINGVEKPSPVASGEDFGTLMSYVTKNLISGNMLVSTIRVDGREISPRDEQDLQKVPLAKLESVEIIFAHPREIAHDTLQMLIFFTQRLMTISQDMGASGDTETEFLKLVDGVQTFSEAIQSASIVLRTGTQEEIRILGADLLSILDDIVGAKQAGNAAYLRELLSTHLPENLKLWGTEGIPLLIRSRDS